jgi:hypothetical protein
MGHSSGQDTGAAGSLAGRAPANGFTRPLADITRYGQGIPVLAAEVVLLFTARRVLTGPGGAPRVPRRPRTGPHGKRCRR